MTVLVFVLTLVVLPLLFVFIARQMYRIERAGGFKALRREWRQGFKGLLSLSEPSGEAAGPGDISEVRFELESGHAAILRLIEEHGGLGSGALVDLMQSLNSADRWHAIVYTTAVARVAYPEIKPVDYLIGELLTHELSEIRGSYQFITHKGREALAEWDRQQALKEEE